MAPQLQSDSSELSLNFGGFLSLLSGLGIERLILPESSCGGDPRDFTVMSLVDRYDTIQDKYDTVISIIN